MTHERYRLPTAAIRASWLGWDGRRAKGSGSGSTNTVSTASQPPGQYQNAYSQLLGQGQQLAQQPYQPYTGSLLAPLSPDQNAGIQATENAQGTATPYINSAAQYINNSTTPLWGGVQQFSPNAVSQYSSPYLKDVVGTTEQQLQNTDAQQMQQLDSNAISSGGWGGDRSGVAQGILGGQQATANNATIANLENTGYGQALGEFNTQQSSQLGANEANSWLNSQAGYGMANLGNSAQNSQLTGANALLGVGGLEQNQGQAGLNIPYEQYTAAQAYPYQQAGWLQGLETNLGSSAGGTGTTTSPAASPISQIAGLGAGALGIAGATGGFGQNGYLTNLFNSGSTAATPEALQDVSQIGQSGEDFANLYNSFAARGGMVPHHAHGGTIIPFRPHRAPGGLVPHHANDNRGWSEPQRRAVGGGLVSLIPGSYAGSPMVPQLHNAPSSPTATGTGDPVGSYLASVQAGTSSALPTVTGLPAVLPQSAPPSSGGLAPSGVIGGNGFTGSETGGAGANGPNGGMGDPGTSGGALGTAGNTRGGSGGISGTGMLDLAGLGLSAATANPVGVAIGLGKSAYDAVQGNFGSMGGTGVADPVEVAGSGIGDTGVEPSGGVDSAGGGDNWRGGIVRRAAGGGTDDADRIGMVPDNYSAPLSDGTRWRGQQFDIPPSNPSQWSAPAMRSDGPTKSDRDTDLTTHPLYPRNLRTQRTAAGGLVARREEGGWVPASDDTPWQPTGLPVPAATAPAMGPDGDPYAGMPAPQMRATPPGRGLVPPSRASHAGGLPEPPIPPPDSDIGGGSAGLAPKQFAPRADAIQTPAAHANPWLALADAGFAMAAGKSPHALENIGAGAQRGTENWISAEHAANQLSAQVDETKARLADTAAYRDQFNNIRQQNANTGAAREQDQANLGLIKAQTAAARANAAAANEGSKETFSPGKFSDDGNTVLMIGNRGTTKTVDISDVDGVPLKQQAANAQTQRANQGDQRVAIAQGQLEVAKQRLGRDLTKDETDEVLRASGLTKDPISGKLGMTPAQAQPGVQQLRGNAAGASAPAAGAPPAVGTVMQGYKFLGGDPAAQSSWQAVQ